MADEIITTEQNVSSSFSTILNYKAITKNAVYPTRDKGMGKIMIEIVDIYLLTNRVILRDWVIVYDDENNEIYRTSLQDNYIHPYTDEQFSQLFLSTGVDLSNADNIYRKLKEIADLSSLIINQIDPPYGLAPNSFEKYVTV